MESQVSPKNIEARVEAMKEASAPVVVDPKAAPAAAPEVKAPEAKAPEAKAPEVKAPEAKAPEVKAPEAKAPEVKAPEVKAPEAKAPEVKAEPAKPEKKQPNDPTELRKWATKLSQENSKLADDMKSIKAALDKLTKKPVDYAELAKNPDSLKAHVEAERQEAIKELTEKYVEARDTAVANETRLERINMEKDTENFPRFAKLFPLIQTLANNGDGRVNWNQSPRLVLEEAYALADQLSPAEVAAAVAAPVDPAPAAPAAPAVTEEQIQARIAEAVAKAKAEAEANLRAEMNGGGLGGAGRGGRRDNNVANDALKTMPLKDLKKIITKE